MRELLSTTEGLLTLGSWFLLAGAVICLVRVWWGDSERFQRCRKQRCVRCGYDLFGNSSGTCPECGYSVRKSSDWLSLQRPEFPVQCPACKHVLETDIEPIRFFHPIHICPECKMHFRLKARHSLMLMACVVGFIAGFKYHDPESRTIGVLMPLFAVGFAGTLCLMMRAPYAKLGQSPDSTDEGK